MEVFWLIFAAFLTILIIGIIVSNQIKKRELQKWEMKLDKLVKMSPPIKTHSLFDAAWDDSTERLQALLDDGADLYEESSGMTALYAAIENGSLLALQFLLEHGADPNRLIGSILPLNLAIDIEITASTGGGVWNHGLINDDVFRPNPVFTQTLLMHGADPYLKDPSGSAIDNAKERHHLSFLELVNQREKI